MPNRDRLVDFERRSFGHLRSELLNEPGHKIVASWLARETVT
jgi:hypothetical protein